ncbi:12274_t:CDS:2, partial [Gigaspora rosea]
MLLIKNPVAGREILESLAYVIEKDTIKEINNSNKKNPCNAILINLELFCTVKGLDLTCLIHFDSDSASNMT